MTVFQLYGEDGRWVGEAETLTAARRGAEELVTKDGESKASIEDDRGTWLYDASLNEHGEHGELVWATTDLAKAHRA